MASTTFDEMQATRERKAIDEVQKYRWRRYGRQAWTCRGPKGQQYSVVLVTVGNYPPHCTCPDWPRMHALGGKCKHFICAEEAEARYQRDIEGRAA